MIFPCIRCGKEMKCKDPYDFYCSKKCEKADDKRIKEGLEKGMHPMELMADAKLGWPESAGGKKK